MALGDILGSIRLQGLPYWDCLVPFPTEQVVGSPRWVGVWGSQLGQARQEPEAQHQNMG